MMDVTATMLPMTVRNERSLFDQIAWSAIPTASRNICMATVASALGARRRSRRWGGGGFHLVSIAETTYRGERAGDDFLTIFEAREHLEEFLAGDAGLDLREERAALFDEEHAFHF